MLRHSNIAAAFRESILRSSKGFQYLHTRDFVTALAGAAFTLPRWRLTLGSRGNKRISSIRRTTIAENRLWMMANMGRVL